MQFSIAAIISAAGRSSRMGGVKKEYMSLGPLTVLGSAFAAFASCPRVGPIVISFSPDSKEGENAARASLPEPLRGRESVLFVSGGPSRRASVHHALLVLESFHPTHVLIHDGARPWVTLELIENIIDAVTEHGAVIPVLPLLDTPKELEGSFIKRHLRRAGLCTAQTPQAFAFPEILKAHEKAKEKEERFPQGFEYTDDAEVWGEFIGRVAVIPGDPGNRKITYPEDLKTYD